MVFYTEPEMVPEIAKWKKNLKKQGIRLVIFTLEPEVLNKFPGQDIEKITYSREHLRKYFINSPYNWALWLDSDIIPEPNVARVLLNIAQSEKCLVVANLYPARYQKECIINGIGCTLTHKAACTSVKFQNTSLNWDGKEVGYYFADDFWFFAMLSGGGWMIEKLTGWHSGPKFGKFVSISHINERGGIKFLEKERTIKIDRVGL